MGSKASKTVEEKPVFGRKMSNTSSAMAYKAWPIESEMCEPTINGALYFAPDDLPSTEALMDVVDLFLQYERLNGVPTGKVGAQWRTKKTVFDKNLLVRTLEVAEGSTVHSTIENAIRASMRDDRENLPWWELLRIPSSQPGEDSSLLLRYDHVLGDGLALVNLMEGVLTDTNGDKLKSILPENMGKKFEKKKVSFCRKIGLGFSTLGWLAHVLYIPSSKYDSDTAFSKSNNSKMKYTGNRSLIKFETLDIEFVRELKTKASVTINDVLFSTLGGAIRRYNENHECKVQKKLGKRVQCRAFMPVAFPRPAAEKLDKTKGLRNKFVFVSQDMGVQIDDAMKRLKHINKEMTIIKTSAYAPVQLALQEVIAPKLPTNVARGQVYNCFSKHSIIFSNVPGPTQPVKFAGSTMTSVQMYFYNLIPQVGILSYNGQIHMNYNVNLDDIPGGEMLPMFYARELVELAKKLDVEVPANILAKADLPIDVEV